VYYHLRITDRREVVTKTYGRRSYSYTILALGTRTSFTLQPLCPQGRSRNHLDRRLGRLQSQCERCTEQKNLLPLQGIEPRPSSPQPVAILTVLPWSQKKGGLSNKKVQENYRKSFNICALNHLLLRVASMAEMRNAYKILEGRREGMIPLRRLNSR
jgi:hypothetical protein